MIACLEPADARSSRNAFIWNKSPNELAISSATSDSEIREALASANIPALLMVLVHLTGDLSILGGSIRPSNGGLGDEQGGIAEADKETVRARAFEVLRDRRDAGNPPVAPLERDTAIAMMNFLAAQTISDDYTALMLEEMGLEGRDERALRIEPRSAERTKQFKVAIIGAGFSGLLMAVRLQEAGIPWVLYEKNHDVGGTWLENRYPGCRVDTPSHSYSYSFAYNADWGHYFATQREVLEYLRSVAKGRDLLRNIEFNTEVTDLKYEEGARRWTIQVLRNGRPVTDQVDSVISAIGQLNRPRYPDIPGLNEFKGAAFHSARWDEQFNPKGKRIAVIGTGASAFQIVPELAKVVQSLDVYQRSAPWIFPTAHYHDQVSEGHRWLLKSVPFYGSWYRFWLFWSVADAYLPTVTVDPSWPHLDRSANALNDAVREMLTEQIRLQLAGAPELVERCIPKYPALGKRLMRDNGSWFRALQRDNVSLVNEGIARITPTGIQMRNGESREYDAIVYATGFRASEFYSPMNITGSGGVNLQSLWDGEPRAYLGVMIPGFPNFFSLYGPNTNVAHGASVVFMTECGVRYIQESIKLLIEGEYASMDIKRDVFDRYNELIDDANRNRTWGMPQVQSWYKNAEGRVTQVWPLQFSEYWRRTRAVALDDYQLTKAL
jgi:4-hydroxyacetophenone monooxygenase